MEGSETSRIGTSVQTGALSYGRGEEGSVDLSFTTAAGTERQCAEMEVESVSSSSVEGSSGESVSSEPKKLMQCGKLTIMWGDRVLERRENSGILLLGGQVAGTMSAKVKSNVEMSVPRVSASKDFVWWLKRKMADFLFPLVRATDARLQPETETGSEQSRPHSDSGGESTDEMLRGCPPRSFVQRIKSKWVGMWANPSIRRLMERMRKAIALKLEPADYRVETAVIQAIVDNEVTACREGTLPPIGSQIGGATEDAVVVVSSRKRMRRGQRPLRIPLLAAELKNFARIELGHLESTPQNRCVVRKVMVRKCRAVIKEEDPRWVNIRDADLDRVLFHSVRMFFIASSKDIEEVRAYEHVDRRQASLAIARYFAAPQA